MPDEWRLGPLGLHEERLADGLGGVGTRRRFATRYMGYCQPFGMCIEASLPAPAADKERKTEISVEACLEALGKIRAPAAVYQRVETAARFFERRFSQKTFLDIVDLLRGIDLSCEVKVVKLSQAVPASRLLVQWQRPRPEQGGSASGLVASPSPQWRIGNFFSTWGHAAESLGVARGVRQPQRYRVKNGGVDVLVSRATAIIDDFTPGRIRHARLRSLDGLAQHVGEMASGGGLQIVIPDPVALYVEPV